MVTHHSSTGNAMVGVQRRIIDGVMARGADLFVVCKNCGSEVSPYVTECPYCGQRVRKRAPKIERGGAKPAPEPKRSRRSARPRFERPRMASTGSLTARPIVTISLVGLSFLTYLVFFAGAFNVEDAIIVGKLDGDWWK